MNPTQKVIDYIRETAERIQTPEGTVTAATMLERFLFTPELQWNRIEKLSGGERKRLYLLKILMTAPNILLLDEPTNDLDIVTLTILEDYLKSFSGAVIAISHDRYFLDKMASEIWELPGDGSVRRYNGNYSDYAANALPTAPAEPEKKLNEKKEKTFVGKKKLKFSYKEQREYETIESVIADLEKQIQETETKIAAAVSDYVLLQELSDQKDALEEQLAEKRIAGSISATWQNELKREKLYNYIINKGGIPVKMTSAQAAKLLRQWNESLKALQDEKKIPKHFLLLWERILNRFDRNMTMLPCRRNRLPLKPTFAS